MSVDIDRIEHMFEYSFLCLHSRAPLCLLRALSVHAQLDALTSTVFRQIEKPDSRYQPMLPGSYRVLDGLYSHTAGLASRGESTNVSSQASSLLCGYYSPELAHAGHWIRRGCGFRKPGASVAAEDLGVDLDKLVLRPPTRLGLVVVCHQYTLADALSPRRHDAQGACCPQPAPTRPICQGRLRERGTTLLVCGSLARC